MQNQMEKELIAVQIYRTPSEVSPEYGDIIFFTKIKINFLFDILMEPDANIGCCRRYQGEGFPTQPGQGMIDQLGFKPGNLAQIKQLQNISPLFIQSALYQLGDI